MIGEAWKSSFLRAIAVMIKWFQKIKRAGWGGDKKNFPRKGVDAGRSAFVRLKENEVKQKKNLLKKLNLYWSQKKSVTPLTHNGYSEPPKQTAWKRKTVLLVGLLLSVMVFIKADGLHTSRIVLQNLDYFRITSIDIKGCVNASAEKVRNAAGVTVSTSQFSIDIDDIARAIRAENNWVKQVDVARRWPDQLLVRVHEYQPHALITVDRGNESVMHYLDRNGEPFIRAKTGMDLDYPVITGLEMERDEAQLSEKLKQPLYFLNLVGANNPNLPAQSVSEIHVDEEEGLVVYLVEYPFPIFLGRDDIRKKYVRLRSILEVLYKPRMMGMDITRVAYIRMNYLKDKAIVGYSESG